MCFELKSCFPCCRNRERQQRFRQRQKAKIESLESQVVKLTAQTKALAAEKEDLGGRALKFQDLLQVLCDCSLSVRGEGVLGEGEGRCIGRGWVKHHEWGREGCLRG